MRALWMMCSLACASLAGLRGGNERPHGSVVTAPKQQYDDYAGVDVKGKVVAMLSNAPARFPSEERAYHASRARKAENAAAHGASGTLLIRTPEEEARLPWARILGFAEGPSYRWIRPDGAPDGVFPELRGSATSIKLATGREVDRTALAIALLKAVDRQVKRMEEGFAAAVEEVRQRSWLVGRSVMESSAADSTFQVIVSLRAWPPLLALMSMWPSVTLMVTW